MKCFILFFWIVKIFVLYFGKTKERRQEGNVKNENNNKIRYVM